MLEQLQHIRFKNATVHRQSNEPSMPGCYWYAQTYGSIVPTNIVNDNILNRPCYLF